MGMLAAATVTLTGKKLSIMYMLKNTTSGRSACLKWQSKIMNPIIQLFLIMDFLLFIGIESITLYN
jgi:hypothetical protein